jgi:hypothetical protein
MQIINLLKGYMNLPQWYLNTPNKVPQALPSGGKYDSIVATPAENCMRNTLPLCKNWAEYQEICERSVRNLL